MFWLHADHLCTLYQEVKCRVIWTIKKSYEGMRGKCKSFCAVCQSAECTSVHVELDLENRIYAKNEKQFIMKLIFRRSNCTALKLALKFWKIIKWLVRFEQHTADKVAALFWEGRIYNAAGTRAESCSSLPIYLIYCTTCADLHMCNIKS